MENDQSSSGDGYTIRRFRPEDRSGVLELDRVVWKRDRSPDWFQWKYESNPFADQTPVFVAEHDDTIVGARPLMAVPIRAGETVVDALQPSDTMVHPDHRRKGLFSRMTNRAIEAYTDSEPALFFNYPNDAARPGYEKLGWRSLDKQVTYYRIQRPARLVSARLDRSVDPAIRLLLEPLVRSVRRNAARVMTSMTSSDIDVTVQSGVPYALLASVYERRIPDELHAFRNEPFLRWRFGSPAWSRSTYLAKRYQSIEAAVVARTRTLVSGVTVTQIADVLPMTGDDDWSAAVTCLLAAIIRDYPNSDLLATSRGYISPLALTKLGFVSDSRPPLSWFRSNSKSLAVRPLSSEGTAWTIAGRQLDDPANWTGTFVERDTA